MSDEFKQDDEITPAVFRKFGKSEGESVIAIFFEEPDTYEPHTCSSYMHVGQHGGCEPWYLIGITDLASYDRYFASCAGITTGLVPFGKGTLPDEVPTGIRS